MRGAASADVVAIVAVAAAIVCMWCLVWLGPAHYTHFNSDVEYFTGCL